MEIGFLIIVASFLVYYLLVLFIEKKMLSDPKEIIDKFLSILLLYAGISIIYYALTGNPFLSDNEESYAIYIFIIGFVALLWTIPNLLKEFRFFNNFIKKGEDLKKNKKRKKR